MGRRRAADANVPPSLGVVEAVAEREGVDPTDLSPPLHADINAEALDALLASVRSETHRGAGIVTFTYCDYTVTAYSDGRVDLDD